jgi:pimeloyl-ACP methyl ester carboxylesterase
LAFAKHLPVTLGAISRRGALLGLASVASACALPAGPRPSGPIAEESFPTIGGIAQWVMIRGADQSRPAMLFLHGGPGEAQSPFLPVFAPWEQRYVVAQWDQRGSGRTFARSGGAPDMTLEQHARDVVDVAQFVLRRLRISKLILVGHSWGSMIGLMALRARPDLFHAFIASGQVVSGRETAESWRASAIMRARAANNMQAVAQLSALTAADLGDLAKLDIVFRWQSPFIGADRGYVDMQGRALAGTPSAPPVMAAADYYRARLDCLGKLMPSIIGYDAKTAGLDLPAPFFVVQGQGDNRTPPEMARTFVEQVRAPAKSYTEIEGGHFACFTNPSGFLDALDGVLRKAGIR